MQFIFWHNLVSPHAAPLVQAVAEAGFSATYVSSELMTAERQSLGWAIPNLSPARLLIGPDEIGTESIIRDSGPDAIHVIAGARVSPWGTRIAKLCRRHGRRFGIISESPDARGHLGRLRRLKYRFENISIGRHFDFVLAMGTRGCDWFRARGYAPEKIYPFGYTSDLEPVAPSGELQEQIIFVGQLIPRKGVDLLITAFSRLPRSGNTKLLIVGAGGSEDEYRRHAEHLSVSSRVRWAGSIPHGQINGLIAGADVLVLPSLEDGWGAVVNEALMLGTPVICSSACGARDLLGQPWRGSVFASGSVEALTEALAFWTGAGRVQHSDRIRIREWAQQITKRSMAEYFIEVMTHVYDKGARPVPPWELPR